MLRPPNFFNMLTERLCLRVHVKTEAAPSYREAVKNFLTTPGDDLDETATSIHETGGRTIH
jgi:hypothetical protein